MDFISKVNAKQKELGLSDKELAEKTGINEYTLYYVKKYRQYLTKVGYYALCTVLDIKVVDYIDALIEENRGIVGPPESNMEIAAQSVDLDYLEKLEKELLSLKTLKDRVETKDNLINNQKKEISELEQKVKELKVRDTKIEKEAYSRGIKDGLVKIQQTMKVEKEKDFHRAENQYKKDIKRLENSIKKLEESYYNLYRYVAFNLQGNLEGFSIPLYMTLEEIHKLVELGVKVNE